MQAYLIGTVVELDKFPWEQGGKTGIAYAAYLRLDGGRPSDAAQRVKITAEQYGGISEGDRAEWPVSITLDAYEGRKPKMKAELDPAYDVKAGQLASVG